LAMRAAAVLMVCFMSVFSVTPKVITR
jgi:hypothetical protein